MALGRAAAAAKCGVYTAARVNRNRSRILKEITTPPIPAPPSAIINGPQEVGMCPGTQGTTIDSFYCVDFLISMKF